MPVRLFWISSAPNYVAHSHSNLYYLTIGSASKRVSVPASFLRLGIIGGIFVLLFFIAIVTSCHFLYIPPREVLVTIYFIVDLCALLVDGLVSFSAHIFYLSWV